jgi:hypothetical protein
MTIETRTILQWVAAAILLIAVLASATVFVFDNISGHAVDPATSALLGLIVSFALTALGYNGGAANTSQAIDKANANAAQVVQTANGAAHEVYNALNPAKVFSTVPGSVHATPVRQSGPALDPGGP